MWEQPEKNQLLLTYSATEQREVMMDKELLCEEAYPSV